MCVCVYVQMHTYTTQALNTERKQVTPFKHAVRGPTSSPLLILHRKHLHLPATCLQVGTWGSMVVEVDLEQESWPCSFLAVPLSELQFLTLKMEDNTVTIVPHWGDGRKCVCEAWQFYPSTQGVLPKREPLFFSASGPSLKAWTRLLRLVQGTFPSKYFSMGSLCLSNKGVWVPQDTSHFRLYGAPQLFLGVAGSPRCDSKLLEGK